MSEMDSVRVAVRIRPLVKSETDRGCRNVIEKVAEEPQILVRNNEPFTFNYVFPTEICQQDLYNTCVQNMVDNLFKGYNVTILAYGQTGSGKTYTMGTAFDGEMNENAGVIPRAMNDIFKKIDTMPEYTFTVTCSFLELYQEQLYDLLSNAPRDQAVVDIREDGNKGIIIPGLTEKSVNDALQTTNCLIQGSRGRAVGATAMNAQSSRSHAIFTVSVQMIKAMDTNTLTTAKFHLVDLAGSERSKKTKATGDRFKEGVKINQGLLALGNVISALGCGQGTNGYVGYRDSKLTRLLQDSLGGNSITLMIACVSPADYNLEETLSTLRYADRARKIKNKPIVNQDPKAAEINRLNGIIQNLRMQLLSGSGSESLEHLSKESKTDIENLRKINANLVEKNRKLQQQLQTSLQDVADIEMRAVLAETAHDELHQKFHNLKNSIITLNNNINSENFSTNNPALKDAVEEIKKGIEVIDEDLTKNKNELILQKQSSASENNSINGINRHSFGEMEDVQQKIDMYNSKQVSLSEALRRLNRELVLKEELHQKVFGNMTNFHSYDIEEDNEKRVSEYENMIQTLEAEKNELIAKLKSTKENVSAKLAEERRKRVQQLEQKISDLKRDNMQKTKLLKMREKQSEKINNLNNEIREMKAARVKLIRTMRTENENFRQWKLCREKEVTQLKEKDRKRQNEMARMESLHNKQRNVLKRKFEEVVAINKRLKDAIEKQTTAQAHRKNMSNNAQGKFDQILSWMDNIMDVVFSVIDAEYSLEQLMDDRAILTSRLKEMDASEMCDIKQKASLEEELDIQNTQINDLQQKLLSSDIEAKLKSICEGIQNLAEARAAVKHLFGILSDIKKELVIKNCKINDLQPAIEATEEKVSILENRISELEAEHTEELAFIEKNYEEKITVLLRELNKIPQNVNDEENPETKERIKIQQETLDKVDTLREELESYKNLANEYKHQLEEAYKFKKPTNKRSTELKFKEPVDVSFTETEEEFEDDEKDPDWVKTPKFRNRDNKLTEKDISKNGVKRNSDGSSRCACKKNCSNRICSCRRNDTVCSEHCKCSDACVNKNIKDEEKENIFDDYGIDADSEEQEDEKQSDHTPKKLKLSNESQKLDVTTPSYPYLKKKRRPFFE